MWEGLINLSQVCVGWVCSPTIIRSVGGACNHQLTSDLYRLDDSPVCVTKIGELGIKALTRNKDSTSLAS